MFHHYPFIFFFKSLDLSPYFTDFDVRITEAMQKISFDPPGTDQTTLCVSSWVSAPKAMANISIFYSESSSMIFGVFYKDSLIVYINR